MAKIVDFGNTYGRFFEKNSRSLKPTRTQQIMRTSPPASGCILPAIPLCKNRGKVETLLRNFLNKLISNIGCHSILRASFFSPIYLHGENHRFWKHLRQKMFEVLTVFLNLKRKKPHGKLCHRACNRKVSLVIAQTHHLINYCQTWS